MSILGELIVSRYVAESIQSVQKLLLYAVDKGLRGRNVLDQLLLILLRICSRSVHPIYVYVLCALPASQLPRAARISILRRGVELAHSQASSQGTGSGGEVLKEEGEWGQEDTHM